MLGSSHTNETGDDSSSHKPHWTFGPVLGRGELQTVEGLQFAVSRNMQALSMVQMQVAEVEQCQAALRGQVSALREQLATSALRPGGTGPAERGAGGGDAGPPEDRRAAAEPGHMERVCEELHERSVSCASAMIAEVRGEIAKDLAAHIAAMNEHADVLVSKIRSELLATMREQHGGEPPRAAEGAAWTPSDTPIGRILQSAQHSAACRSQAASPCQSPPTARARDAGMVATPQFVARDAQSAQAQPTLRPHAIQVHTVDRGKMTHCDIKRELAGLDRSIQTLLNGEFLSARQSLGGEVSNAITPSLHQQQMLHDAPRAPREVHLTATAIMSPPGHTSLPGHARYISATPSMCSFTSPARRGKSVPVPQPSLSAAGDAQPLASHLAMPLDTQWRQPPHAPGTRMAIG